jgi:hypothetical protein
LTAIKPLRALIWAFLAANILVLPVAGMDIAEQVFVNPEVDLFSFVESMP